MDTRRSFLIKGVAGCLVIMLPAGTAGCSPVKSHPDLKTRSPRRALVAWYSQTGHTRRIGKIIGSEWIRAGLSVDLTDYRDIKSSDLAGYDLIALGTPVYYMDVPVNLRRWIRDLPSLEGIPVAAYVTYGGHGDGQHHTACGLLEELARKGAVPAGMDTYGNMSTFAPTWSMGNEKRTLKYKDRPNEQTYARARRFAADLLEKVRAGQRHEIDREFGLDSLTRLLPQVWFTRLMIGRHYIDKDTCIECGLCQDNCPVDAIDLSEKTIDRDRCLVCLGCVNNCPAGAVRMTFMGSDVYGFQEFLKRNHITILEPQL
jgi:ferredoxin/flavodoxin